MPFWKVCRSTTVVFQPGCDIGHAIVVKIAPPYDAHSCSVIFDPAYPAAKPGELVLPTESDIRRYLLLQPDMFSGDD